MNTFLLKILMHMLSNFCFILLAITFMAPAGQSQNLLSLPESMIFDESQHRYLISNYQTGDIIQVDSNGVQSYFVQGGNAIQGLEIVDNVLYVGAGQMVRGFDLESGEMVMDVSVPGISNLNDVTADTSGNLYVSDVFGTKIIKVRISDQTYSVFVDGQGINQPNGIFYDKSQNRILVCSYRVNSPIQAISLVDTTVTTLATTNLSYCDGITKDKYGNCYVTSWSTNSIYLFDSIFSEPPRFIYYNSCGPADISYDIKHGVLAIPLQICNNWSLLPVTPSVVSVTPLQNELNVLTSTNISATFNTDMDATTINDTTMMVNASSTGLHMGTITYDSLTKTVTIDPDNDFCIGEVVTVILTTKIKSSQGISLDSGFIWSFTLEVSDGYGAFYPQVLYSVTAGPAMAVAADLNEDGNLDLTSANRDSDCISVLFNNGDGTFTPQIIYLGGNGPHSVCPADLDEDGDIDLAVPNWYSHDVSVFLNNGNGSYVSHNVYSVGQSPSVVVAADLDADGDLDLATGNWTTNDITLLFNNGNATFTSPTAYAAGADPHYICTADLDSDGDMDLTTANWSSHDISVYLNNGRGIFSPQVLYSAGQGPYAVSAADIDADSDLDLVIANGTSDDISVLSNNGDGTFILDSTYTAGNEPISIFTADLDADGDLDLATANWVSRNVSVLLNNGDGTFAPQSLYQASMNPHSVFAADLDADGCLDLAVANWVSNKISILYNLHRGDVNGDIDISVSDVVFLINYLFKGGPAPNPLKLADVNCDGEISVSDVIYLINYLFKGGSAPVC